MSIQSINPATGETVGTYQEMESKEIGEIIQSTHQDYLGWRNQSFEERRIVMIEAARLLRRETEPLARLMAVEMGKPLAQGRGEVEKCAWVCEYYAENSQQFLKQEPVPTDARKSFISYQPLGVILAVMPWNFPLWQVFRFAAPALMAGNGGVLKHASNVFGSALAIEKIFRDAGFPRHIFRTLLIGSSQVEAVIKNPKIRAVTLTGSTPAGQAVAAQAGSVLKKTVLELGGSDPYVILPDAPLDETAAACVASRMINTGQSCIAAKRFIVPESIKEEFETLCVRKMREQVMGDPLDEKTTMGPMARVDLRDELHQQVLLSIQKGARCLLGGTIPEGKGAFYPPTILTDVTKGMPAYDEELFGPVAAIIPVKTEEEAIEVANDSPFGLGSAIFTDDTEKGEILAREIEAGSCFVNTFVRSDPRLPFGGIKESGYGRELSYLGIREFVNIKTVYIQ